MPKKREDSLSPKDARLIQRVNRAIDEVAKGKTNNRAAKDAGFADSSHLNEAFKRWREIVGVTFDADKLALASVRASQRNIQEVLEALSEIEDRGSGQATRLRDELRRDWKDIRETVGAIAPKQLQAHIRQESINVTFEIPAPDKGGGKPSLAPQEIRAMLEGEVVEDEVDEEPPARDS